MIKMEVEVSRKVLFKDNSEELKVAYYVVYAPFEVDSDGHFARPEEIIKACHRFMDSLTIMERHRKLAGDDYKIVENYISPCDLIFINPFGEVEKVLEGSWIVGVKALNDNAWERVKSGEFSGISMGARVKLREPSEEEIELMLPKSKDDTETEEERPQKILELFDIVPLEVSLTSMPKTGRKVLLWKSKEDIQMEDSKEKKLSKEEELDILLSEDVMEKAKHLSDKAIKAFKRAVKMLEPFKDEFPASFWKIVDKLLSPSYYPTPKSLDGYDIPEDLATTLKAILEENARLKEKILVEEALKERQRLEEIKKANEKFVAEKISFLPVDKSRLVDVLTEIEEELDTETVKFIKEAFERAVEAIKSAKNPTQTNGIDTAKSDDTTKHPAMRFMELVKKAIEEDTSNTSESAKRANALSKVSKEHPDLAEAYRNYVISGGQIS
jgi:hypothetical protein